MRPLLIIALVAFVGCGGETPNQKYETALHIYTMELARLDRADANISKFPGDGRFTQQYAEQSSRLDRAKKILGEAEAALPK